MQYSNSKIYQFAKTQHFLERQWLRGVPDEILFYALKFYRDNRMKNTYLILSRTFIEKHLSMKLSPSEQGYLVISIRMNKLLITTFWTNQSWLNKLIRHKATSKIINLT